MAFKMDSNKEPGVNAFSDWLIGGGDMGELIRSMDWSETSLGPRADWPQTLRVITNVALSSTFAIAIFWGKDLILIYNDAYRVIAADKHPRAIGKSMREIWPDVWEFNKPIFEKVMQKGQTVHLEDQFFQINRRAEIEDAYFNLSYSPIWLDEGRVGGTMVTLMETTQRIIAERKAQAYTQQYEELVAQRTVKLEEEIAECKRMENEMLTSKDFLEKTMDLSPFSMWISDDKGTLLRANRALYETLNVTERQIVGRYNVLEDQNLVEQGVMPQIKAVFDKGIQTRFSIPWEGRKGGRADFKGAKDIFIDVSMFPIKDNHGKVLNVVCQWVDITELKRVEEALRKSEAQLSNALKMAKLGHWELDVVDGMFTFTDSFYAIFRTTANEMGGYKMSTADYARHFVHPEDAYLVAEETRKALETDDPNFSRYLEHRMLYADGSVGHLAVRFFIVKDDNGKTIKTYGVNQDITMRKQIEEELQKSQKLESLSVLAAGIAHDFNNLLCGIFGYVDLAAKKTKETVTSNYLAKVLNTTERARALTHQLLTFAKGGAPIKKIENLIPLIKETTKFALSGSSVSCSFDLPENLWSCEFDRNQIGQVINNIVINAQQAMPDGGNIEISAVNIVLAEKEHATLSPGNYVKVSIKDHGIGMPEEILPRIFDPFFTTKAKGHGLGLAICYSIIRRHNGCIDVESKLGKGSVFHLYLPAFPE